MGSDTEEVVNPIPAVGVHFADQNDLTPLGPLIYPDGMNISLLTILLLLLLPFGREMKVCTLRLTCR